MLRPGAGRFIDLDQTVFPDGVSVSVPMGHTMRLATFNLDCFGARAASRSAADARVSALRDALAGLRADVLCLQEVNAQTDRTKPGGPRSLEALKRLIDGTVYESFDWRTSTGRSRRGPMDVHNLVVLSRYRIGEHRQIWHDLVPPPVYRSATADPPQTEPSEHGWDRPFVHAVLEPDGAHPLHVLNLHLRAPLAAFVPGQKQGPFAWKTARGWAEGFYLATLKRVGQALEARFVVDTILDADPEARIVVCGDMNADAVEMPVRILCADTEDTGNPGLADRMLVPVERIAPEADRYSVIHAGHKHMLDHILVSRALADRCRKVEIHNSDLPDEVFDEAALGDTWASNHAPLVAEFDI